MNRFLASLLIFSLGWSVTPAHGEGRLNALYDQAKQCYFGLKESSARRAERTNWLECVHRFVRVYDYQPKSPQAYTSIFTAGRLYDRLHDISLRPDDQTRALRFYYKVISEYPEGRLTDDALFHQGEIFLARKEKKEALARFKRVAGFFPDSDHLPRVEKRLRELEQSSQASSAPTGLVELKSIDYAVAADGSIQIVANATGPVEWTQNKLTRPSRVYFNFPNSRLSAGFARDLAVKGGALTRIRASQFNDNTSRLVLDLNPVDKLKVTTRRQGPKLIIALSDIELSREPALETPPPAQALAAPRMAQALQGAPKPAPAAEPEQVTALLDALVPQSPSASVEEGPRPAADDSVLAMLNALSHSGSTAKKTASKAVEKTAGKVVEEVIETPVRTPREASVPKAEKESARAAKPVATKPRALLAKPKRARPPEARAEVAAKVTTIVVDPGHGGKDYGAKGRHGLYEKEVNLKVSKLIKKILETRYNYRVVLTRDDDTFIPLDKRGDVANEKGADLFVSVHANAAKRRSAHGIETYYLGTGHSAQAQETAARENGELVKSVKDDQVQQILASLISTTKINDSAMLAGHVQDELYKNIKKIQPKVRDLGVKEGPFFVLHDTNMPSILVEVGFVTHRREERSLKDPKYLNQLARAIAKGIHGFLNDRGPTI